MNTMASTIAMSDTFMLLLNGLFVGIFLKDG